jgi:hypothetical protein
MSSETKILDIHQVLPLFMQRDGKWQDTRVRFEYLGILQSLKACFIKYNRSGDQSNEGGRNLQVVNLQTELSTLQTRAELVF